MITFLTSFDFLTDIKGFRYFGETHYKSFIGGCLSIFLFIFSFLTYLYFFLVFLDYQNVEFVFQKNKGFSPLPINFNNNSLIAFGIRVNNNIQNKPNYLNISLTYINQHINSSSKSKLNLTKCDSNKITNISFYDMSYQNIIPFSYLMCIDNIQKYPLTGNSFSNNSNRLLLEVFYDSSLDNSKSFQNQKTELIFYYSDINMFPFSFDYTTNYINYEVFQMSPDTSIDHSISYSQIQYYNDDGFVFSSNKIENTKIVNSYDERRIVNIRSNLNFLEPLMTTIFIPSHISYYYQRKFMKIQDYLSLTTSLILIFYIVLQMISHYFSYFYFLKEMIDKLFESTDNLKHNKKFYNFTNFLMEKGKGQIESGSDSTSSDDESKKQDVSIISGDYTHFDNLKSKVRSHSELGNIQQKKSRNNKFLELKRKKTDKFKTIIVDKKIFEKSEEEIEKIKFDYCNEFLFKYTSLREKMIMERRKVFSNTDLFILLVCPCIKKCDALLKMKLNAFTDSYKKMNIITDMSIIIKKVIEVDALKYLLLDEHQRRIFKFVAKPDCSLNYSKFSGYFSEENFARTSNFFDVYDMTKSEIEKFRISFNEIQSRINNKHESVDRKLMNCLNPLINQVIEQEAVIQF